MNDHEKKSLEISELTLREREAFEYAVEMLNEILHESPKQLHDKILSNMDSALYKRLSKSVRNIEREGTVSSSQPNLLNLLVDWDSTSILGIGKSHLSDSENENQSSNKDTTVSEVPTKKQQTEDEPPADLLREESLHEQIESIEQFQEFIEGLHLLGFDKKKGEKSSSTLDATSQSIRMGELSTRCCLLPLSPSWRAVLESIEELKKYSPKLVISGRVKSKSREISNQRQKQLIDHENAIRTFCSNLHEYSASLMWALILVAVLTRIAKESKLISEEERLFPLRRGLDLLTKSYEVKSRGDWQSVIADVVSLASVKWKYIATKRFKDQVKNWSLGQPLKDWIIDNNKLIKRILAVDSSSSFTIHEIKEPYKEAWRGWKDSLQEPSSYRRNPDLAYLVTGIADQPPGALLSLSRRNTTLRSWTRLYDQAFFYNQRFNYSTSSKTLSYSEILEIKNGINHYPSWSITLSLYALGFSRSKANEILKAIFQDSSSDAYREQLEYFNDKESFSEVALLLSNHPEGGYFENWTKTNRYSAVVFHPKDFLINLDSHSWYRSHDLYLIDSIAFFAIDYESFEIDSKSMTVVNDYLGKYSPSCAVTENRELRPDDVKLFENTRNLDDLFERVNQSQS